MSAHALELNNVTRRFGDVVALREASLSVRRGTLHALLGENGAGKTTLMRIAYGLLRPSAGEVRVEGKAVTFTSPADAIAAGIGMVQQHSSNVAAMTVWENVFLGGNGALNLDDARSEVRALNERLGFALDPDTPVEELTVAAQQRLEILKAIRRNARVLILDEPTAILAPEEANDLYAWLRGFAGQGGTAVVVTHKLDEARRYTDELTVLRAGATVARTASAAASIDEITRAMIGEALVAFRAGRAATAAGNLVVHADGLTLRDERQAAVIHGATFDVRAGEVVAIAGVEGSGHHHLMLAIAGRLGASAGSLKGPARVAVVPEDRHRDAVVLPFTLTENAAVKGAGHRRGRIPWNTLSERVDGFLRRFDVRAAGPSAAMATLSGGNQQKFVLARELDDGPELIVAENPTRGLDVRASAFVREQLRAARDRGAAVVVYSSDLDELLELADRVLVVHRGTVSAAPLDRTRIGAAMLGVA